MAGALHGIRIIEFTGIGPGPFCGMMLADHGAEVIRIDRTGGVKIPIDPLSRSRKSIVLDIKRPEGAAIARALVKTADGLIEGFRPGVMEKLGLGPDILLKDNPKLVYGRMTGWGQTGPYAQRAGHDINYIALTGTLHSCGRKGEKPTPPMNYIGDFGGGGMVLAFGMVSAILSVKNGGEGQVIDCAMTDGSAALSAMTWGFYASGMLKDERGVNLLDTGAHFYDTYETSDGKWIAIGAIEPQFYAQLRDKLGIATDPDFDNQYEQSNWDGLKAKLAALFKTKTRDAWCALLEGSEACFAPVLSLEEAPNHPHNRARETFVEVGGVIQPAPAPRFDRTPAPAPRPARPEGADADAILRGLGKSDSAIEKLRADGVIG